MPSFVFDSFAFDTPLATMAATELHEVQEVLRFAEREALNGSYVAVMLSYEAAPAFDPILAVHEHTDFPLAWAAAFPNPSNNQTETSVMISSDSWTPRVQRDEYDHAVKRIRDLIAAGDTYQVNYTFPVTSTFSGDHYSWYRTLRLAQGADYSAYIDLGRYKVLCLSPELFFKRQGNHVITKPMKGTVRRGRWAKEDQELAQWLKHSRKDRAENVMIVDLLRNDLGKVSVPGSVNVTSLFDVERFETVWQMTSTVESTLNDATTLPELMEALFPCGSITGAPKIRTMQIIRELERFPRGVYTGAIGLLQPGGDCVFNVTIRTVVIDTESDKATFGVGGGITIDSTADREYQECLVKSKFLYSAPVEFQLFESLLLDEGKYLLLPNHVQRLRESAVFFGFVFHEQEINHALDQIATANVRGSFKVRLTLWKDGELETETSQLECGRDYTQRVGLATKPVDSFDRYLFHKTTCRDFYREQLAAQPECDDIVFWNERGEITESTIANVVLPIENDLWTPPVQSGLLAGTFRNQLLAEGQIKERTITVEELQTAEDFFLINSVCRWSRGSLRIF
jgi:para-aminobenzoate synthetase/4-amino-4-deoxychorismate lyase